jgi:hypothetical protein
MANLSNYIAPALIAFVVPIALGLLLKSVNAHARSEGSTKWLEYGPVMKGMSLSFLAPVIAITMAGFFVEPKDRNPVFLGAAFFGALTLPLLIECFLVRIGFDDQQVFCLSGWRRRRVIPWDEIESASYSGPMMWWVISTRNHGKIRAHLYLSGVSDFLDELRRRNVKIAERE